MTKKYKKYARLTGILSLAITLAPVMGFVIAAFIQGSSAQKLSLGLLTTVAIILTAFNIIMKINMRSTIWILLLGIYICLDNIMPVLLTIAIGTIADELVLTPLHKKYKQLAIINSEIDKREDVKNG